MTDQDGTGSLPSGSSGNRPPLPGWLPPARLNEMLADLVWEYRQLWPKARVVSEGPNWVMLERGWLFWKTTDVILVYMDGRTTFCRWR